MELKRCQYRTTTRKVSFEKVVGVKLSTINHPLKCFVKNGKTVYSRGVNNVLWKLQNTLLGKIIW